MTTTRKKKKERERKKEKEAIHLSTLGCSLEGWVIGMGTKENKSIHIYAVL
jgi:hypothetical protein